MVAVAAMLATALNAEVKLPSVFGNGMVLQRNSTVAIWGRSDSGKSVTVTPSWGDKVTVAVENGKWRAQLATADAATDCTIEIDDGSRSVVRLTDIAIGEVWICSGQSNMEMPMKGFKGQPVANSIDDIARSTDAELHLYTAKRTARLTEQEDMEGNWCTATPATVREFSATAYYFGRMLRQTLGVPVGLICTAWGGSACEAWMTPEMLKEYPQVKLPADQKTIDGSPNRTATALYNAMLHPVVGYGIRGFIWYQGEDNCNRAYFYADLFEDLIEGWRKEWNDNNLPFYYCQIAPYDYGMIGAKYNSALIREAQMQVESRLDNVGMAVLMDAGLKTGIHPATKRTAGERLALLALNKTYTMEGIVAQPPLYKSIEIKHDTVVVNFDRCDMWLYSPNRELKNFKVAGADHQFYPARAWIYRKSVFVLSDSVKQPEAVRYGFDNWVEGDLFGTDGVPISSFRTDNWDEK